MASPPPPDIQSLIAGLARALRARNIGFMLIGGQAVLLHGAPRLTDDIDLTLGIGPDRVDVVQEVVRSLGLIPLAPDPTRFAQETFVYPARDPGTGFRVDFIFSTTPFEQQAIAHAVLVTIADERVPFANAEDLIIHKLFAGRARDWDDAVSVVRRQGPRLDWNYIEHWSRQFAQVPGREDLPAQIARLRASAG